MTHEQIICHEPARALVSEFIRRWGVRSGVQRAARRLGATVTAVNEARRYF